MKGIYKHDGNRFRVRKYDRHIGVFNTLEEAVEACKLADENHIAYTMWQQYILAKKWLEENGKL